RAPPRQHPRPGAGGGTNASDSRTIQVVPPPTIASAANQVFVVGQAPTTIAAITVAEGSTPTITAANDIRMRIPATFNMSWNTALATATLTGGGRRHERERQPHDPGRAAADDRVGREPGVRGGTGTHYYSRDHGRGGLDTHDHRGERHPYPHPRDVQHELEHRARHGYAHGER